MYEDLYNMCLNIEGVMNMFSEELTILDRNTVTYMIDESCRNCAFLNEDCPPYYCDFGEDNPVICAVKMRKMKEYKKEKLRSCLDG